MTARMPSPRNTAPLPSRSASTSVLKERSMIWSHTPAQKSASHSGRQIERNDRKRDQDDKPHQVGDNERQYAFEDGGEIDVLDDAFDDEDIHPDGRMDEP